MVKEEYAIILEYLPNGYPLEGKMMPIAQAIGKKNGIIIWKEEVSRVGGEETASPFAVRFNKDKIEEFYDYFNLQGIGESGEIPFGKVNFKETVW